MSRKGYFIAPGKKRLFCLSLFFSLLAALSLSLLAAPLHADDAADWSALARAKGADALTLLNKPTLYREASLAGMPGSAEDFEFLLDRPRTSVALAGKLHKSLDKYTIEQKRPGLYHIDDGGRLVGDMELVVSRPGARLYYISGYWKIVSGINLRGRMALLVQYGEKNSGKGKALDAKAKGYMLVDNSVAGAALKVLIYLFPNKVDARISRFGTAVDKVVHAVHENPEEALKRLENDPRIPPEEAREFRARFIRKTPA